MMIFAYFGIRMMFGIIMKETFSMFQYVRGIGVIYLNLFIVVASIQANLIFFSNENGSSLVINLIINFMQIFFFYLWFLF